MNGASGACAAGANEIFSSSIMSEKIDATHCQNMQPGNKIAVNLFYSEVQE